MRALSLVTWFCSEFWISSSHFPFPSSLPSRAAAYVYAPELMRVCACVHVSIPFWPNPFPMCRLFTIYVNTTSLPSLRCANTGCNLSRSVCAIVVSSLSSPFPFARALPSHTQSLESLLPSQSCDGALPTANC